MQDKQYLLSLLDYNQWANEDAFARLRDVPKKEIAKERPSFMKSLLISVNHMVVIDMIWLAHMRGEPHTFEKLQTILHDDLDGLAAARADLDQELRNYVEDLSGEELIEVMPYTLIGGNEGELPRYMMVTHIAMHGAYHRGVISDMFGQIPQRPLSQDIPVWARTT